MKCPYCPNPIERNPISGNLTCFRHPLGHERRQLNRIRSNFGAPPIKVGQTGNEADKENR